MLHFPSPSSSRIASIRLRVLLYQNCSFPPRSCAFSRNALACPWFLSRLANTANKYKHLDTSYRALNSQKERYVTYIQKIHYSYSYLFLFIFQIKLMNRHRNKKQMVLPKLSVEFLSHSLYYFVFSKTIKCLLHIKNFKSSNILYISLYSHILYPTSQISYFSAIIQYVYICYHLSVSDEET